MNIQSSRNIQCEHVTLEGERHDVTYHLEPVEDIVLRTLDLASKDGVLTSYNQEEDS